MPLSSTLTTFFQAPSVVSSSSSASTSVGFMTTVSWPGFLPMFSSWVRALRSVVGTSVANAWALVPDAARMPSISSG